MNVFFWFLVFLFISFMLLEFELARYLLRKDPGAIADMSLQMSAQYALVQGWTKRVVGFSVVLKKG